MEYEKQQLFSCRFPPFYLTACVELLLSSALIRLLFSVVNFWVIMRLHGLFFRPVRLDGTLAYEFFQGSLNGQNFLNYIQNTLVPTLKKCDIVVMDNLSCHKVKGIKEAIESVGASVLYLPPYSPDLNPIEMMWSKMKAFLRKLRYDTVELLHSVIPDAFSTVSISDISG